MATLMYTLKALQCLAFHSTATCTKKACVFKISKQEDLPPRYQRFEPQCQDKPEKYPKKSTVLAGITVPITTSNGSNFANLTVFLIHLVKAQKQAMNAQKDHSYLACGLLSHWLGIDFI